MLVRPPHHSPLTTHHFTKGSFELIFPLTFDTLTVTVIAITKKGHGREEKTECLSFSNKDDFMSLCLTLFFKKLLSLSLDITSQSEYGNSGT
ncbi:hypothetical protein QYF36_003815 [Acer negundo]|nr:hypothetical protein QYF36_003815 [Acer negundo]